PTPGPAARQRFYDSGQAAPTPDRLVLRRSRLGCRGRGGALPALVVAANRVRLGAARVGEVDGQQLEANDVDDRVARRHERRVAAELAQRGDRGARTVGSAPLAL